MPRLCGFYPGTCLTSREKARKNLSHGSEQKNPTQLPCPEVNKSVGKCVQRKVGGVWCGREWSLGGNIVTGWQSSCWTVSASCSQSAGKWHCVRLIKTAIWTAKSILSLLKDTNHYCLYWSTQINTVFTEGHKSILSLLKDTNQYCLYWRIQIGENSISIG